MRRKLREADESALVQLINKLYQFINGTLTGQTWHSNAKDAWNTLWESIKNNTSKSFDSFAAWIKSMFQQGGIFNKIGTGIGGIIRSVYSWFKGIILKLPGATEALPGFGVNVGEVVAMGLVAALALIGFYKVFKGILGSSKDEDEERYSEAVEQGNKFVVDLYNFTEHLRYQQKYKMLSEGLFGGFFEFIGKVIRKAFKLVGDIVKDAYRGAKKHPIAALIVLVFCFLVCFCMKNPIGVNTASALSGQTVEMPGLFGQLWAGAKGMVSNAVAPIKTAADKVSTIASNPGAFAKTLPVVNWFFSESSDKYIDLVFESL